MCAASSQTLFLTGEQSGECFCFELRTADSGGNNSATSNPCDTARVNFVFQENNNNSGGIHTEAAVWRIHNSNESSNHLHPDLVYHIHLSCGADKNFHNTSLTHWMSCFLSSVGFGSKRFPFNLLLIHTTFILVAVGYERDRKGLSKKIC